MKSTIEQYAEVQAMKPVDVLAVMDKNIQWTVCRCVQTHCQFYERCPERLAHEEAIKARAAIAELIEVSREFYQGVWTHVANCTYCDDRVHKMASILGRIA